MKVKIDIPVNVTICNNCLKFIDNNKEHYNVNDIDLCDECYNKLISQIEEKPYVLNNFDPSFASIDVPEVKCYFNWYYMSGEKVVQPSIIYNPFKNLKLFLDDGNLISTFIREEEEIST